MRFRTLAIAALLLISCPAFAQQWRIEIGTGLQPLHMGFIGNVPSWALERELADKGQEINQSDGFFPSVIASGIYLVEKRVEIVLTGNVAWSHHALIQYDAYEGGFDPNGKPRYNLSAGKKIGMKDSSAIASFTGQCRYLWTPESKAILYSAIGVGISAGTYYIPTPTITPIGIRLGGRHLYAFVESSLGPFASFVDGGLGCTF